MNKMKLYHISQTENCGYDTYSDAVVVANSEEEARHIHPAGEPSCYSWRSGDPWYVPDKDSGITPGLYVWAHPRFVTAELIGEADSRYTQSEVICASFHAG